ncbi:MAG: hypothetical protein WC942_07290 [Clostridia bacterium]|jgi:hypothetical protein
MTFRPYRLRIGDIFKIACISGSNKKSRVQYLKGTVLRKFEIEGNLYLEIECKDNRLVLITL